MSIFHFLISSTCFYKHWSNFKITFFFIKNKTHDVVYFDEDQFSVESWIDNKNKLDLIEKYSVLWKDLAYVKILGNETKITSESIIFFPSSRSIRAGAKGGKSFLLEAQKRKILITSFDEGQKHTKIKNKIKRKKLLESIKYL